MNLSNIQCQEENCTRPGHSVIFHPQDECSIYVLCDMCTYHNVKNRGATELVEAVPLRRVQAFLNQLRQRWIDAGAPKTAFAEIDDVLSILRGEIDLVEYSAVSDGELDLLVRAIDSTEEWRGNKDPADHAEFDDIIQSMRDVLVKVQEDRAMLRRLLMQ